MTNTINYTIDPADACWPYDGKKIYEPGGMLAVLIANGNVFVFRDKQTNNFAFYLNMNDTFDWATADAEHVTFDDLEDMYKHFEQNPAYGDVIWTAKRRRQMPITPVVKRMRDAGVDVDALAKEIEALRAEDARKSESI